MSHIEKRAKLDGTPVYRAQVRRSFDDEAAAKAWAESIESPATEAEASSLKKRVRSLEAQLLNEEYVRREIFKLAKQPVAPPSWLIDPARSTAKITGVPTILASDWHWGEIVDSSQINGINQYNPTIAKDRARVLVEKAIYLLTTCITNSHYPGIVFALGGDMVSGDIHEELVATNHEEIMPTVVDIVGVLSWCITELRDAFGKVFVPAVTGNHGRNTKKIRAKGRAYTSFDWLIYQMLAMRFQGDGRVSFLVPDGPDAQYKVYNHTYMLTHGDQFRGGDGMIGHLGPLCVAPDTLILLSNLSYKKAEDLNVGDEIVAFDETVGNSERRKFKTSYITESRPLELECYEIETDDGQKTIASIDHPWLCRSGASHTWIKSQNLRMGSKILSLGKPWLPNRDYDSGYLAGILDGEGSLDICSGRLSFAQQNNACLDKTLNIQYRISERFKKSYEGVSLQCAGETSVVGIRYIGLHDVTAFSTESKTFIGNGMFMHNTRGDHKKRSRNGQISMPYDTMLVGHFHQLMQLSRFIVNGSLIGYNEYAFANNFGFEEPQQALWVTHPEHGITFSMPVKVDEKGEKKSGNWLEVWKS